MKIKLAENFRAIFYAPFYALKALDFATREGVNIEWLSPGSPGSSIDDVKSGAIELTWGGPMRVMKDHDTAQANGASLICFGEVVSRDPFCLVGRPGPEQFKLSALTSSRLGVVSEVPTPWFCLQADLRDAGIDIATMKNSDRLNTALTMPQQLQAIKNNELDIGQFFEPYVSQALADKANQLLYAGYRRGPTVYTTFICSRDGLERHHAAFAALNRALRTLQDWIAAHSAAELAQVVSPFFSGISANLLLSSIKHYYDAGIWARTPYMSRSGFDRLSYSMHTGGFISRRMTYESCTFNFEQTELNSAQQQPQSGTNPS